MRDDDAGAETGYSGVPLNLGADCAIVIDRNGTINDVGALPYLNGSSTSQLCEDFKTRDLEELRLIYLTGGRFVEPRPRKLRQVQLCS